MDFFDREARAQKQTRRLGRLFGVTVLAVLALNSLVLCPLVWCGTHPLLAHMPWWHPVGFAYSVLYITAEGLLNPAHFFRLVYRWQPVLWVSLGTAISITAGSYFKVRQLSKGGSVVAAFLGGRRVAARPGPLREQQLRNVVEEMAIASGTPVPEIYVLDNERGINAFSAGHTRDDVAIGVTRGCVELLDRDELQGVVAHEFSHILNGDTRLNMKLIGLAHGLFWPTLLGRVLIYGTADPLPLDASVFFQEDRAKIAPTAPLGFLFVVLGSVSLPFVRLIKSAICRQREWLADAAAVQFTRNPSGIAGALKTIGGLFKRSRLDTPHAEVASHLYFGNCRSDPWLAFLGTHPPLLQRIVALDPSFDGNFTQVKMLPPSQAERDDAFARVICSAMASEHLGAETGLASGGGFASEQIRQASLIRLALPDEIKQAAQTPEGAASIIYALVLSGEDEIRTRQMQILQTTLQAPLLPTIRNLAPQIDALADKYKLALAELTVPALRENDPNLNSAFERVLEQLIECDAAIDLFEYTLTKMVRRQLHAHFEGPNLEDPRYGRVCDLLPECALLLSAVAHVGSETEPDARAAFSKGAEFLDAPGARPEFLTRSQWDLAKVDEALNRLGRYHEPLRRNVLVACGKTVTADRQVTPREAELLRAIAEALDCPIPRFVEAIRGEELAKPPQQA